MMAAPTALARPVPRLAAGAGAAKPVAGEGEAGDVERAASIIALPAAAP